jgi:hypothetical protein
MIKANVEQYWGAALQGLAYWIAYKQQYFDGHLLPEGAIVAELAQLLAVHIPDTKKVECERLYKDREFLVDTNIRADIVISDKPEKNEDYHELIQKIPGSYWKEIVEVKRYEQTFKNIEKDSEKLIKLYSDSQDHHLYQVVVGQGKLPDELFTGDFNLRTRNIYTQSEDIDVRCRMSKKAYSTKRKNQKGVFAVLLEVSK